MMVPIKLIKLAGTRGIGPEGGGKPLHILLIFFFLISNQFRRYNSSSIGIMINISENESVILD